ncbi:phage repressor protein C with HTH and peptisase S24 domain [Pseudomonas sp. PvR086]
MQEYGSARNTSRMEFKERLKIARRHAGLNQTELAERAGLTQTSISDLERGKSKATAFAAQIASACGVSPMWLAEGSGDMLKGVAVTAERTQPNVAMSDIETWDDETPLDDDEVYVPFLQEVELAAGSGRFAIAESTSARLRFFKKDLRHNNVQFSNAKCVAVSGNSMLPVLRDGATVGVNVGKNTLSDIVDGEMYAINHHGQLRVKQVYRTPTGIRLRSFNRDEHPDEDYTFQQIQEQQISILGHVFWWAMYSR